MLYLSYEALSIHGKHDPAPVSLENRDPEPVFDSSNPTTNGAMCNATSGRSRTERSRVSYQTDSFQIGKRWPRFWDVFQIHTSLLNCELAYQSA